MTPSASSVVRGLMLLVMVKWSEAVHVGGTLTLSPLVALGTLPGKKRLRELPNRPPSALQGSVDFGPEVTSSEKSLKVLLNADDKVKARALAVTYTGPGQAPGGRPSAREPGFPGTVCPVPVLPFYQ